MVGASTLLGRLLNPLRKTIRRKLGWTTLSIQMPTFPGQCWKVYGKNFYVAEHRIKKAVKHLHAIGVDQIYLIGHSMGARI